MAYGQKYSVTFATRADKNVLLKIWQDPYTGAIINLQGAGVNLEYIPNSDNPYEPIFASQLGISIDFTDNLSDIINFTNIDDRYNYVEMYVDNVIQWVGFIINDNVQVSYSTGRKIVTFNATDGLGMLKDIPFVPPVGNLGVNDKNSLLTILRTCFNSIGFKNNRNTITMCSYFANGMSDRAVNSWRDPFVQTFMCYRDFLKDEYTYTNCLDIISNIAKSFGCRIFQANAKWWIVAVNEFAETNAYYTEYNTSGAVVNNGDGNLINTSSTIQPYLTNTSGLYFIDNSQIKILNKGFYKIIAEGNVDMAANYIPNGNLADNDTIEAEYWTRSSTGDGTCLLLQNAILDYYYFELTAPSGGPAGTAGVTLNTSSNAYVTASDALELNITIGANSIATPIGFIDISINTGSTIYYLNNNKEWQTTSTSYTVYNPKTSGAAQDFVLDLKTAIFPGTGQLSFTYRISEGIAFVTLTNFVLKIKSIISDYNLTATLVENEQYTNTISLPYGSTGSQSLYPSCKGALLYTNNAVPAGYSVAAGWYRYGQDPIGEFYTISELIVQQYINTYGQNIINLDASVSSFYTANTTYRILNAAKLIFATDTDPASINVSGKSYMLGNATIDFPSNQTNLTLLQISNTEIVCTRVNKYSPQTSTF
jgi:hypothetical protein